MKKLNDGILLSFEEYEEAQRALNCIRELQQLDNTEKSDFVQTPNSEEGVA